MLGPKDCGAHLWSTSNSAAFFLRSEPLRGDWEAVLAVAHKATRYAQTNTCTFVGFMNAIAH